MAIQELCFMSGVSAEVWASVAQTAVAAIAIGVGAGAIVYQVRAQARQQENRDRAVLRQRLASYCVVARDAADILWTAASCFEVHETVEKWAKADQASPSRHILARALGELDTKAIADARNLLAMLTATSAYLGAEETLTYVLAMGGHLVEESRVKVQSELSQRYAVMNAQLVQLESARDALVPV